MWQQWQMERERGRESFWNLASSCDDNGFPCLFRVKPMKTGPNSLPFSFSSFGPCLLSTASSILRAGWKQHAAKIKKNRLRQKKNNKKESTTGVSGVYLHLVLDICCLFLTLNTLHIYIVFPNGQFLNFRHHAEETTVQPRVSGDSTTGDQPARV